MRDRTDDLYEQALSIAVEEVDHPLPENHFYLLPEFFLNPRMLRGSDFFMRWEQGRWSEKILIEAFDRTGEYKALPYGPSGVAPDDPRGVELYFERLDAVQQIGKRPDLLLLKASDYDAVRSRVEEIGPENLPFTREDDLAFLRDRAVLAAEVENSLWVSKMMPHYGKHQPLADHPELQGFKQKTVIAPTIIIKEEDRGSLQTWQDTYGLDISVFHLFYDQGYFLSWDRIQDLIKRGIIRPTDQEFSNPGGKTKTKRIYKVWYSLAQPLGQVIEEPKLTAAFVRDKNGHILPYVKFEGGKLEPSAEILADLRARRPR